MTAKEELKCNCIVQPVYNDILSRLSESEIDKMKTNKLKLMTELMKSFNNSKLQIETCLKENNSLELLEEFKKELNSSEILKKIKDK